MRQPIGKGEWFSLGLVLAMPIIVAGFFVYASSRWNVPFPFSWQLVLLIFLGSILIQRPSAQAMLRRIRRRWKPLDHWAKVRYSQLVLRGLPEFAPLPGAKKWQIIRFVERKLPHRPSGYTLLLGVTVLLGVAAIGVGVGVLPDRLRFQLDQYPSMRPWSFLIACVIGVLALALVVPPLLWAGYRIEAAAWRARLLRLREDSAPPRCGGCQYPLAGIPLVNNAVTCPECGDLNRFWPGSQPHRAMVEAMGQPPLPTTTDPGPADEARRASDRS